MRSLTVALCAALLLTAPLVYAEIVGTPVALTVQGTLISLPDSPITLELGKDVATPTARQDMKNTLVIQMLTHTPQSGFVIKGATLDQFKVTFTPDDKKEAVELEPSVKAERAYTYLPLAGIKTGGTFTITMPGQPSLKKKAFLN